MRIALLSAVIILASALRLGAQTAAAPLPMPNFQPLGSNGEVLPGASVCVFAAGTSTPMNSYTSSTGMTANPQPLVLDSNGRGNLWLKQAAKIVLYAAGGTGCPNSAVQLWSVDGIPAITKDPVFNSVTSATVFNSRADINGGNAVQSSGGTFTISGSGNAAFQEVGANHFSFTGFASAPTPPGTGFAFMYYDTTLSQLLYNLGGAGWVPLPGGVAGIPDEVQFNVAGAFGASANFAYNDTTKVLTLSGLTTGGVDAPVFSSSNTGTDNAFVAGAGAAVISGAGNITAQNVTVHSAFNSQADVFGGNAIQTSGGTFTISGAGNGAFQALAVTTNYTAAGQTGITSATCSHWTGGICDTP